MARDWKNPVWRRVAMQAAMWGILAATLGVAALVDYRKEAAILVELAGPTQLGDVSLRFPAGWQVTAQISRAGSRAIRVFEPSSNNTGRKLSIIQDQLLTPVSPHEYLLRVDLLTGIEGNVNGQITTHGGSPVDFGSFHGILLNGTGFVNRSDNQYKAVVACAVLPWREAIAIRLEGSGPLEPSDIEIVRQIAGSLSYDKARSPIDLASTQVRLEGNIRIDLPQGYHLLPEDDANLTERQAVLDNGDGRWASLTLVPCVFLSKDRVEELASLLSARGLPWWETISSIKVYGQGELAFGPLNDAQEMYVSYGFLQAAPNGQAVLAIFHGSISELAGFAASWQEMNPKIQFDPKQGTAGLLTNGAKEIQRLVSLDFPAPKPGSVQWWIWRHVPTNWNYGWSRVTYTQPQAGGGTYSARWKNERQNTAQIELDWRSDVEAKIYERNLYRREAAPGLAPIDLYNQAIRVEGGYLFNTLSSLKFSPKLGRIPAPQQFIPGPIIPTILGQLSNNPMILRTDFVTEIEDQPMLDPMLLVIHSETLKSKIPATQSTTSEAFRSITIEVNGSGRISRWYLNEDGTVAYADFAGGIRRLPADVAKVKDLFDSVPDMRP